MLTSHPGHSLPRLHDGWPFGQDRYDEKRRLWRRRMSALHILQILAHFCMIHAVAGRILMAVSARLLGMAIRRVRAMAMIGDRVSLSTAAKAKITAQKAARLQGGKRGHAEENQGECSAAELIHLAESMQRNANLRKREFFAPHLLGGLVVVLRPEFIRGLREALVGKPLDARVLAEELDILALRRDDDAF